MIKELDWTKPTAIVLGNELKGISEECISMSNQLATIPMFGFV